MDQAQQQTMTPDDFLAWERQQDSKWEFDGVRPVGMTGGSGIHSAILGNLLTALNNRLRGRPCRPHGPDLKVMIGTKFRYPDALVTCTPFDVELDIAPDPRVLFEILSKSTERTDRFSKLLEYRSIPSLARYVLLEQETPMATVYARAGTLWTIVQLLPGETLEMPEIGIEIPVDELYADVVLP